MIPALKFITEALLAGGLAAGMLITGLRFHAAINRRRALRRLGER